MSNGWQSRSSKLLLAFTLCFAAVAVYGNPFLYERGNSGHYLAYMFQAIDPQLFAGDQVVVALARLNSAFYSLIGTCMRIVGLAPQQAEGLFYGLYIVSRLLLSAVSAFVMHMLRKDWWPVAVFLAWTCHPKAALVGGVKLFLPTLTHNEVALIIGLCALACLLSGHLLWGWGLLGVTVFIHALVGLHLALCLGPALLWRHRLDVRQLGGVSLFGVLLIGYLFTSAPPSMSAAEGAIFLAEKGEMAHISLSAQGWYGLLNLVALLALTLAAHWRFTQTTAGCAFLVRAIVAGGVLSCLLSLLASYGGGIRLALFQPLRAFLWVTLFCGMLLSIAVREAFYRSRTAGVWLAAALVLSALSSGLLPVVALLGAAYLGLEEILTRWSSEWSASLEVIGGMVQVLLVLTIFVGRLVGGLQVSSLRSSLLLIPGLLCLLVFLLPCERRRVGVVLGVATLVCCLVLASVSQHQYYRVRIDRDWQAVGRWAQAHTAKRDRFITPPEAENFRALALRATLSERTSALVWVSPMVYLDNSRAADRAAAGYTAEGCDLDYLFQLAREWGCRFVVAKGRPKQAVASLFMAGDYSVIEVPTLLPAAVDAPVEAREKRP